MAPGTMRQRWEDCSARPIQAEKKNSKALSQKTSQTLWPVPVIPDTDVSQGPSQANVGHCI
jgi:2-keto-4-pentenoate hydratase/2-oxohepta-3-ene-1,7-dioic acid hydratase in catechol pathway